MIILLHSSTYNIINVTVKQEVEKQMPKWFNLDSTKIKPNVFSLSESIFDRIDLVWHWFQSNKLFCCIFWFLYCWYICSGRDATFVTASNEQSFSVPPFPNDSFVRLERKGLNLMIPSIALLWKNRKHNLFKQVNGVVLANENWNFH